LARDHLQYARARPLTEAGGGTYLRSAFRPEGGRNPCLHKPGRFTPLPRGRSDAGKDAPHGRVPHVALPELGLGHDHVALGHFREVLRRRGDLGDRGLHGGGRAIPASYWTAGASALQMKFSYTTGGLVFTACGASLSNIRYALIFKSASAGGGPAVCYCSLSSGNFTITSPNTLTILPAAAGVFTLARGSAGRSRSRCSPPPRHGPPRSAR
jgi:hypothetical protein